MKKETRYFIINYSSSDTNYIDEICNYLKIEIEKIVKFLGVKEFGEKININLFDDVNILWNFHINLFNSVKKVDVLPKWVCGFSWKNNIYTLSLKEYKKN